MQEISEDFLDKGVTDVTKRHYLMCYVYVQVTRATGARMPSFLFLTRSVTTRYGYPCELPSSYFVMYFSNYKGMKLTTCGQTDTGDVAQTQMTLNPLLLQIQGFQLIIVDDSTLTTMEGVRVNRLSHQPRNLLQLGPYERRAPHIVMWKLDQPHCE